ncbi:RNA polymerase sigma-70 factor [Chitinophaga sp. YR627]|uniref:RNA polymerase sigma-70 factor n=1 Tax=Chitinophaga sp. YR627 TaxID=1881041 RepID=UPI0015A6FA46|nr:RNA polymerase sigma-70 factor [Chitinophaga sp. YR627]
MEPLNDLKTDSALLEQYFLEYFEVLHSYAHTILKDNDEAKDAVQAVFIQLWQKRESLQIRQSVRAYLYAATHNHCLNHIKSRKIRRKHYDRFASGASSISITDIEQQIVFADMKKEVLEAMKALPDKCREIFFKSRFEEKSYSEIATELQISVKTVEAQMGKALRTLRTILSERTFSWLIISAQLISVLKDLFH